MCFSFEDGDWEGKGRGLGKGKGGWRGEVDFTIGLEEIGRRMVKSRRAMVEDWRILVVGE